MTLKTTVYFLRKSLCHDMRCISENVRRCCSNQPNKRDHSFKRSPFVPPADSKHDWIGPPHRLSNLRPIIYQIPENETELEKQLRILRQETEDWNHAFWTNQNITFNKSKEAFILSQLKEKGMTEKDEKGRKRSLHSEEMAVFYKHFLDENCIRHNNYNKEWYRRNFTITLLMGRVAFHKLWRMFAEKAG
ncbi:apoptogenic protein 1, mitochondrial [Esox lucius]|uniref:C14orf153 n=1 Tax=Esox lucius TaxID=8010 RepID=C1BW37_ESOLU|nr:apoptogenic protein 1, mitochondrial [Esox lucius]ACO13240.1 C14orf153 precursor [Esox lucius]